MTQGLTCCMPVPNALVMHPSVLPFGAQDGGFYAQNPDGTLKWSFASDFGSDCSPAIDEGGTIYACSGASGSNALYAFNADGSVKWSSRIRYLTRSSPAIGADGTVYVTTNDRKLLAVNPDGSMKWDFPTGGEVWNSFSSPAIAADGTIYVAAFDSDLFAINPDGTLK